MRKTARPLEAWRSRRTLLRKLLNADHRDSDHDIPPGTFVNVHKLIVSSKWPLRATNKPPVCAVASRNQFNDSNANQCPVDFAPAVGVCCGCSTTHLVDSGGMASLGPGGVAKEWKYEQLGDEEDGRRRGAWRHLEKLSAREVSEERSQEGP